MLVYKAPHDRIWEFNVMQSIWQQVVDNLQKVVPVQHFSNWIEPIQMSHIDDSQIYLSVPNQFFKEWVGENYLEDIHSALALTEYAHLRPVLIINEDGASPSFQSATESPQEQSPIRPTTPLQPEGFSLLNPRYTFDLFVPGAGNQFAHAASLAVANNPATTYNPLFIYGGVGLGKSHLLHAIGHQIKASNPQAEVCYCSTEKFMYEMVNAIKLKTMDDFRERYRSVDVLLIDDIQFIAGKERTQVEFFHAFNALYESHKQIVITSDKFPKEMPNLEERLRSRFEWGLIADIQPPDLETKIAILKKKAEFYQIDLSNDVIFLLASSDTRNVRELEGMLIRLKAYSSLQHVPITISMAKENLKNILVDKKREITIEHIQKIVADYFGLKVADLKSERRLRTYVQARQTAIWLCRDMTSASYPDIGAKFGGKDHSTVIHATKKIDKQIKENQDVVNKIEELKKLIHK